MKAKEVCNWTDVFVATVVGGIPEVDVKLTIVSEMATVVSFLS